MASGKIKPATDWILGRIADVLAWFRLTPNILTVAGFFLNAAVAYVLVEGRFFLGGWLFLVVSLTDLLDGILARSRNMATRFGAFLDSCMDRFSDAVIFMGLVIHYAIIHNVPCVLITATAMTLAQITSYTRARAEVMIPKCKVGFMERPERVILLAIGLVFNRVPICLLLMAISSTITILDRFVYTYQELKRIDGAVNR